MFRPSDIPKKFNRLWSADYVHKNSESEAGWSARNSVAPRDCLPRYQKPGGGVCAVTDLPDALDRCISNIKQRRAECDRLIDNLTEFRNAVTDGNGRETK